MQKRINTVLTVLTVVAFVISIGFMIIWFGWLPMDTVSGLDDRCAIYFPVVPFLFLQLLLCKNVNRKWLKVVPISVIVAIAIFCTVGYAVSSGWDGLGYLIILIVCAAPALGCVLGFVVNWIWKKWEYRINRKGYALMIAFPVLVLGICIFENWYSWQGARTIEDIPSKEAVVTYLEDVEEKYVPTELAGFHRDQIHYVWGEPQGVLSGFWGDIWTIDNNSKLIVYYDENGAVEYVTLDRMVEMEELQAMVVIDGVIYFMSGEGISMEVDESAFLGYANPYMESVAEKDKDRYFDSSLELPYAKVESGIVVLYMDEWHKCTPKGTK